MKFIIGGNLVPRETDKELLRDDLRGEWNSTEWKNFNLETFTYWSLSVLKQINIEGKVDVDYTPIIKNYIECIAYRGVLNKGLEGARKSGG